MEKSSGETKKPSLTELFLTFALVGVTTYGGGYAMLPILQREIVEKRHWASGEEISDYFAIGQCTPGIIAVNTATFIGYSKRGVPGAIFATLGLVFPSLIIIMALAGVIMRFSDNPHVQKAFNGIRVCVCALILNAIIKLWKGAVKNPVTVLIFLVVLLSATLFKVSPVLIVADCALLGLFIELWRMRFPSIEDDEREAGG